MSAVPRIWNSTSEYNEIGNQRVVKMLVYGA
jgi:hypothetical protein